MRTNVTGPNPKDLEKALQKEIASRLQVVMTELERLVDPVTGKKAIVKVKKGQLSVEGSPELQAMAKRVVAKQR